MVGKCQRSNQVGKWLNFYHYHLLLQIKIHRPGFQAWMAHEVFLVIEVLMSGKNKKNVGQIALEQIKICCFFALNSTYLIAIGHLLVVLLNSLQHHYRLQQ